MSSYKIYSDRRRRSRSIRGRLLPGLLLGAVMTGSVASAANPPVQPPAPLPAVTRQAPAQPRAVIHLQVPAAQQPAQAVPGTDTTNYWSSIPDLISKGLQIVLRVPTLNRRDVAEAVRLAEVNKGAEVILITSEPSFYERDSLTAHLSLMRTKTYTEPGRLEPFVIIDGVTYAGQGLIGYGPVHRLSATTTNNLIQRTQRFIDTGQQINPVWIVQQYLLKTRSIKVK